MKFIFTLYDGWIGYYWNKKDRNLYVLPIPWCGVVFNIPKIHYKGNLKFHWKPYCVVKDKNDMKNYLWLFWIFCFINR